MKLRQLVVQRNKKTFQTKKILKNILSAKENPSITKKNHQKIKILKFLNQSNKF